MSTGHLKPSPAELKEMEGLEFRLACLNTLIKQLEEELEEEEDSLQQTETRLRIQAKRLNAARVMNTMAQLQQSIASRGRTREEIDGKCQGCSIGIQVQIQVEVSSIGIQTGAGGDHASSTMQLQTPTKRRKARRKKLEQVMQQQRR